MADDSNRFVLYFDVYYYSYFIIGVFAQSVLLYLIKNKSPPRLYSFCYFLINTWIVQFAVLLMTFFTQSRCLPNSTTYTVLPRGPCKYFGPTACFAGYHISLAVSMAVALSFANTVLFRYLPIRFHGFNKNLFFDDDNCILYLFWTLGIFKKYVPSPTENIRRTIFQYTNHFPGFSNIQSIPFLTATSVVAIGAHPMGSFFIIFSISSLIKKHKSMSEKTKSVSRMMVKGLAIQTVLPFLSYAPIVSLYLYSQFTGKEIVLVEHFQMLCSGFPALCDPFISCYCILPYRQSILKFISRKVRGGSGSTKSRVSTISVRSVNPHIF